uniref:Trm112 family protein n=1 Tax=Parenemella sanctibonifatiensis TaxID=2016505 RepID=UPI003899516D
MSLPPELLEILTCPNCSSGLAVDHDREELVCTGPSCGLAYPIQDEIPVLLVDEARKPERG